MVAVTPPAFILVTGASGFIAAHVCQQLLQRGFSVRGTVRSKDKGDFLANLFKEYGNKFEYVVIPDMQAPGCFDEAVKGVDAVEHTASPFHFDAKDPEELLGPAIKGTTEILESIQTYNPDVKRVIVTSSVAAIMLPKDPPFTFTEEHWNTHSPKEIEEKGAAASQFDKYRASKSLAERAAWDFKAKGGDSIKWDLICINPCNVYGPNIHQVPSLDALNTSSKALYTSFTQEGQKTGADAAAMAGNWVDVRDVALAHVEALVREEAGGNRYITSAGPFSWQMMYDALQTSDAKALPISSYPKGTPGCDKDTKYNTFSGVKAEKELGFKYITMEKCVADTLRSLREYGFKGV